MPMDVSIVKCPPNAYYPEQRITPREHTKGYLPHILPVPSILHPCQAENGHPPGQRCCTPLSEASTSLEGMERRGDVTKKDHRMAGPFFILNLEPLSFHSERLTSIQSPARHQYPCHGIFPYLAEAVTQLA